MAPYLAWRLRLALFSSQSDASDLARVYVRSRVRALSASRSRPVSLGLRDRAVWRPRPGHGAALGRSPRLRCIRPPLAGRSGSDGGDRDRGDAFPADALRTSDQSTLPAARRGLPVPRLRRSGRSSATARSGRLQRPSGFFRSAATSPTFRRRVPCCGEVWPPRSGSKARRDTKASSRAGLSQSTESLPGRRPTMLSTLSTSVPISPRSL